MSAVAASIAGYIGEIGSPHPEHLPRRKSQERIGMFSYQRISCPHRGQREGGCITDCFGSAPHRRMQTLRKLPSAAPSSANQATNTQGGSSASLHTRDLSKQDGGGDRHVERLRSRREADRHPAPRGGLE